MANIGSLVVRIGADVGPLEQGLNTAAGRMKSFGSQMKSVGTGLTLGISAPIAGIATMALKSAADFEQSMNLMQAMTGATADQMGMLQQQALDLGASTSFSAGEAAEAMLELSKAGMSVEQTSAAIGGVMDLAAAGNIGLADAATITANAINSFGLEASAATEVANTFAAAANASSADVTDLAQGFQMASAVFAANGQGVDDLAASLAILSNNGIAGSDAGTSLKTMMMRLAASTDEAQGVINELGIQIYDSTGAMLPFFEIVTQLSEATADMSDSQRNAALQTIFGADAIRAATILAEEGGGAYEDMIDAVTKEGSAAALAEAQMKGLGGAIEYFKGSIDSLLIGTALPFTDALGDMIRGAADLLSGFTKLPPSVQRFAAVLVAALAVGGPLLILIGTMATALAALLSPIGLVIAGLVLLGVAVAANWKTISRFASGAAQRMQPAAQAVMDFGRYVRETAQDGDSLNDWLTHLPEKVQPAAEVFGRFVATAHDLWAGETTWGEFGAGLVAEMEKVPGRITTWANGIDWAGLIDSAGDVGATLRETVKGWFSGLDLSGAAARLDVASGQAGELATALSARLGKMLTRASSDAAALLTAADVATQPIQDAVVGWFDGLTWDGAVASATEALEGLRTTVDGWRDDVLAALTGWVQGVNWEELSGKISGFVDNLAAGLRNIDLTTIPFSEILTAVLGGPLSKALGLVKWVVGSENFDAFKTAVTNAIGDIDWAGLFKSVGNFADAALDLAVGVVNEIVQGYTDQINAVDWTQVSLDFSKMVSNIAEKVRNINWQEIGANIGESLRALFTGDEEAGTSGFFGLAAAVWNALKNIKWAEVFTATGELFDSLANAVFQLVGGAIASLFGATLNADGSWTAPQWVTDLIAWIPDVPEWVTNILAWRPEIPQWVTDLIAWIPDVPQWVDNLLDWTPPMPDWVLKLLGWNPPAASVPLPDAGNGGSGGFGGSGGSGGSSGFGDGVDSSGGFGGQSVRLPRMGADFWEMGPVGADAGAGGRTIIIQNMPIYQNLDWEEIRWRLAELTRRRR